MKIRLIVLTLLVVLLTASISASYEIGNLSAELDLEYGPLDFLRGWLNFSFNDEPGDNIITTSEGNSIELLDFLNGSGSLFSCEPTNCGSGFSPSNPEQVKTFTLNSKESKFIGIKLNGIINSIGSVNLTLSSDAGESCQNQVVVDLFNDGVADFGNTNPSGQTCSSLSSYGCFDSNEVSNEFNVEFTPYCQVITLSKSPGFRVGAWVKNVSGDRELSISLYDKDGVEIPNGNCVLPDSTNEGGEVSCDIDYLVTESEEYFVCLNTLQGDGDYKIKGYPDSINGCGFFGDPSPFRSRDASYQIFANGRAFAPVGNVNIDNDFAGPASFSTSVESYLRVNYGNGIDCSTGCIVPVRINSEENQEITFKDLELKLQTTSGSLTIRDFYDLESSAPKITSDFQKIGIDNLNFSVPSTFGNNTLTLSYEGTEILEGNIVVKSVVEIQGVTPKETFALYPTLFTVILDSLGNITQYDWDFGDGLPIVRTTSDTIKYSYEEIGSYEMRVSVESESGLTGTKTFQITVGSPQEIIDDLLEEKKSSLVSLITSLDSFSVFEKRELEKIIDTELLNDGLKKVEKDFGIAVSDSDFVEVMDSLISLNVPDAVTKTKDATSVYYPEENVINLDIVSEVGTGSYDPSREDDYIKAVYGWNQENLNSEIKFKELSGRFEDFSRPLLRIFELKISEKQGLNHNYNLFIRDLENLQFQGSYLEKETDGYWVIPISQSEQTIIFSTSEDFDFINIPAFISPEIGRLTLVTSDVGSFEEEEGLSRWIFFVLIISLLIIIALVAYVILQEWYKRKYENYLFKNRNKLFNLISYIHNSKQSGVENGKIEKSLKKVGWNSEQVTYAVNKYEGKRTGMWELPIDKIMGRFRKKEMDKKLPVKVAPKPLGMGSRRPSPGSMGLNRRFNSGRRI